MSEHLAVDIRGVPPGREGVILTGPVGEERLWWLSMDDLDFDDGLSAFIAIVMRSGAVDYPTARAIVHALRRAGGLHRADRTT